MGHGQPFPPDKPRAVTYRRGKGRGWTDTEEAAKEVERPHLLPGQRARQEPDLHFGTVWELCARFQEYHIIFRHPFTDHDILPSSYHQTSW
jgi:hypothetical protein